MTHATSSSTQTSFAPPSPSLNTPAHVKYWLRCLKTYLPNAYTEQDASRIPLAFFTLSALDLLDSLDAHTTHAERAEWADFIYSCQHPEGGFRAFTGSKYGGQATTVENARWDPANIAGTYFAIASLVVLGDDLKRVRWKQALAWVGRLQHEDGSFGELLAGSRMIEGGQDVRFCFIAALLCNILVPQDDYKTLSENINVDALTEFILLSKSYDGGIGRNPYCESHGCTYCGVSTLAILGRLPQAYGKSETIEKHNPVYASEADVQQLLHWLVSRQTCLLSDYRDLERLEDGDSETENDGRDQIPSPESATGFTVMSSTPALAPSVLDFESLHLRSSMGNLAGFNGRCNKPADTCYSFWAGSTLAILGQTTLINVRANRNYLLEKTQHPIGGFGKFPGDLPDILHSYMALAALSVMGEPSLKPLDPLLCMSLAAKARLAHAPWRMRDTM